MTRRAIRILFWTVLLSTLLSNTPHQGSAQFSSEPETSNPEVSSSTEPETQKEPKVEPEVESEVVEPEGGADNLRRDIYVGVYSLIIILIIVSNVGVIIVVLRSKILRKDPNNIFLTSLVLARSCIGSFVVPARITGLYSAHYLGSVLCKICHFIASGSAAASVFSIVAVALMKMLTLKRKETSFCGGSVRKVWRLVGIIWMLGFVYGSRAPIVYDLIVRQVGPVSMWACTINTTYVPMSKYFIIVDLFVLFAIPLCIIMYCYCKVIAALAVDLRATGHSKETKANMRNIEMIVTLVVLFIVCSVLPLFMSLYMLWGGPFFEGITIMEDVFYMFSYSNSWFNVLIFWYFREDLRGGFFEMVGCRKVCNTSVRNQSPIPESYDVRLPKDKTECV